MRYKFLILILLMSANLFSQIKIAGRNHSEISDDKNTGKTYFENWTDLSASYQHFIAGLRYELHRPPQPFSPDTFGHGLAQRYLTYQNKYLDLTIGNYYAMLGRGVVFRAYENRALRWDTNLDGIKVHFKHHRFNVKFLSGKPRDRQGNRLKNLQAGEFQIRPYNSIQTGLTWLQTHDLNQQYVSWGSVYSQYDGSLASLYGEYARENQVSNSKRGNALYLSGSFFVKDLTIRGEYRRYEQFQKTRGTYYDYNNPPTAIREHLYSLLNRHQHLVNYNDEKGFLIEGTYPLFEDGILTLNYTRSTDLAGENLLFREYFAQFEVNRFDNWEFAASGGLETDLEAEYINVVGATTWSFSDLNSIKMIAEHQHEKIKLTQRQFYSQIYLLSLSHAPWITVSLLAEHTTEQTSEKKNWFAGQVDFHFKGNADVTVFAGARREGKICAGGVCVNKPEFKGVEMTFILRY